MTEIEKQYRKDLQAYYDEIMESWQDFELLLSMR